MKGLIAIIAPMILAGCSSQIRVEPVRLEPATLVINDRCGKPIIPQGDYLHVTLRLLDNVDVSGRSVQIDNFLDVSATSPEQSSGGGFVGYRDSTGVLRGWVVDRERSIELAAGSTVEAFVAKDLIWDNTNDGTSSQRRVALSSKEYEQLRLQLRAVLYMRGAAVSNEVVIPRETIVKGLADAKQHVVMASDMTCEPEAIPTE
ncbi:hypothetical protein WH50_10860 [Pokkaliibacter plantistimulans]|uniref:Lipoprotein n=1 Tax=Pokkaliibacter plantistimulans TaxID=1635171 RepID=A0ABX5M0L2_9GAMM|nr:hypothetical protein [Pokkaliibacter plantistimulans]PXF31268.1 hypothetical protein WH50_10860 [Pokkaliibacter plantistimulans]